MNADEPGVICHYAQRYRHSRTRHVGTLLILTESRVSFIVYTGGFWRNPLLSMTARRQLPNATICPVKYRYDGLSRVQCDKNTRCCALIFARDPVSDFEGDDIKNTPVHSDVGGGRRPRRPTKVRQQ